MLVLVLSVRIFTESAAARRYIVEEQEPLVWCDEDYPILDANDLIDPILVDDVNDEYN